MDQMMVDVSHIPDVCAGDVAVLIGRDGEYILRAEDMAEGANSITNETLSCLGARLERMEKL
jgi:serine/alanine racemase